MKTLEAISEYNEFEEKVKDDLKLDFKDLSAEIRDQYKAAYRVWIHLDEKTQKNETDELQELRKNKIDTPSSIE